MYSDLCARSLLYIFSNAEAVVVLSRPEKVAIDRDPEAGWELWDAGSKVSIVPH